MYLYRPKYKSEYENLFPPGPLAESLSADARLVGSAQILACKARLLIIDMDFECESESGQLHFLLLKFSFVQIRTRKCEVGFQTPTNFQDAAHQPSRAEPALRHLLPCLGSRWSSNLDHIFSGG